MGFIHYCTIIVLALRVFVTLGEKNNSTTTNHMISVNVCHVFPSVDTLSIINDTSNQVITLYLCSGNSSFDFEINFLDKEKVSLIGSDNSILVCGVMAGIEFFNVKDISMNNITMIGCGSVHTYTEPLTEINIVFSSSIFIRNSRSVSISNTNIDRSQGVGIIIIESSNFIEIMNCVFQNGHRGINTSINGGGGLYIEMRCHSDEKFLPCTNSSLSLHITGTVFRNNSATVTHWIRHIVLSLGNGGGLNIHFKGDTSRNNIVISDCSFEYNKASNWGGGLNIAISNSSTDNNISIENSSFYHNWCRKGGGAADIGYLIVTGSAPPNKNIISFTRSSFIDNSASFGGAVIVYCTQSEASNHAIETNEVLFDSCEWKGNRAFNASAVSLYPHIHGTFNNAGNLLTPTFRNCTFTENSVMDRYNASDMYLNKLSRGNGCFSSTGYKIAFEGEIHFGNNSGSALYLISSILTIESGSTITFDGNTGYYGGAIALFGTAIIHIQDNINFFFTNNIATARGGALYQQSIDSLGYISLKNCFIHYFNPFQEGDKNITFTFKNNSVDSDDPFSEYYGKSIYVYSIKSCRRMIELENRRSYYHGVANFVFENSTENEISTEGTTFVVKPNLTEEFFIIPGDITDLPVAVVNDFDNKIPTVYLAILRSTKEATMSLDPGYVHVFDNRILIYGNPGEEGNISLSISSRSDQEIMIHFVLHDCPPGFILENVYIGGVPVNSCICSGNTQNKTYLGISRCNRTNFRAKLKRGYWIGYMNLTVDKKAENRLVSALCPRRYCSSSKDTMEIVLPRSTSVDELERVVCFEERTGFLCGECRENYTAFYHTTDFNCELRNLCQWGWLFFLMSEILPVTVLFIIVIVMDIQLTAGFVQGFILYIQILDTLHITANRQIWLKDKAEYLLQCLKFVVNIFNLSFFTHNKLSFCLWETASSLDIITFQYVTIVYSLSLVLVTVAILNCKSVLIQKCLMKIRGSKKMVNVSVIHGLSGFLVMCYSQCTKTTLMILTPVTILSKGLDPEKVVAFYDGRLPYMRDRHLLYGIPALVFLVTMIILPPIIFLIYPLCYRVFSLLGIEESKFSKVMCTIFPLEKFKPFFDSFQSSFKDKHRYFAGLYFTYRLSALVSFASFHDLSNFYTVVEIQFILMLLVHAWVQPYKKRWHNQLDAFIFGTLAVINIMTLFNFNRKSESKFVELIGIIQITIAYLPLLYMLFYTIRYFLVRLRHCCNPCRNKIHETETDFSLSALYRRDNSHENLVNTEVMSFSLQ